MLVGKWPDRAIVVVHGIGEQRQGSTRDALVRGLNRCNVQGPELIQEARAFEEPLPQDPLRVSRGGVVADVYEVHWAPHTAKKTTARAVLWWLYRSTFIPGAKLRKPSRKTWWDISAALMAIIVISVLVLFAVASLGNLTSQVACRTDPKVTCELPEEQRRVTGPGVTWGGPDQVGAILGALTESLTLTNRPLEEISLSHAGEVLTRIPFQYWLVMVLIVFLVAQALFRVIGIVTGLVQGREMLDQNRVRAQFVWLLVLVAALFFVVQLIAPVMVAFVLVLVGVGAVGRGARRFLAESLGDVQVYAERDENSEHYKAREAVLQEAEKTFALVAKREYKHIVVLGHSLGAVVAFTAMDRLVRRIPDLLSRIEAYITFGSALEKVLYFFERRSDPDEAASARLLKPAQAIAAEKIWLNLWYKNDVVANPITTFQPEMTPSYSVKDLPPFDELIAESQENMVVNIDYGYPVLRLPIVWTHSRYWSDMAVLNLIADIALPT